MLELEFRWLAYGLMVLAIASVHAWFPRFAARFQGSEDRWLGFIGGVALGYVVIYMLPKLSAMTLIAMEDHPDGHLLIHARAHLVLLLGILVYLVIDRLDQSPSTRFNAAARQLEYGVHGVYHFLAGYLVVEMPRPGLLVHGVAAVVLALHTMGMANVLRHHRPEGYGRFRWWLVAAVVTGGAVGILTELPRMVINITTAFISGIIILNVVAEELPRGRRGRLRWLLLGVAFFLLAAYAIGSVPASKGG